MRRREFVLFLAGAMISARPVSAQQKAIPVIGFLNGGSSDKFVPYFTAFRNGLAAMGYIDGQNVAIEYRNAEGQYDRLPGFAADLVERNVSAIAVFSPPAVFAAKAATAEQTTKIEVVINLKTAQAFGLTIPQSVLGRADEVIE